MQKPDVLRSPRDVMRWIAADATERAIELHAGSEVDLEVRRPIPNDQKDIERYMAENDRITAAIERHEWLEYGPFADVESFVLTVEGAAEIEALVAFEGGLNDLPHLLEHALASRRREFLQRLRAARHEAAAVGATQSGRARLRERSIAREEVEIRRGVAVEVAMGVVRRLGGRRPDAGEAARITDCVLEALPVALGDIDAAVPWDAQGTTFSSRAAEETAALRILIKSSLAESQSQPVVAAGDTFHIRAVGSQVNAGGVGNTAAMTIDTGLLERMRELAAELRATGASELADSAEELHGLARKGEAPKGLWAGMLKQLQRGAALAGAAEGGFALSERAVSAAREIARAFGVPF